MKVVVNHDRGLKHVYIYIYNCPLTVREGELRSITYSNIYHQFSTQLFLEDFF